MKPFRYTEEQENWLRDLETTTAYQCEGYLHTRRQQSIFGMMDSFCCLGRACVSAGLLPDKDRDHYDDSPDMLSDILRYSYEHNSTTQILPFGLAEKLRLRDGKGSFAGVALFAGGSYKETPARYNSLIQLNDDGFTFKEIAKIIRDNPRLVFTN